MRHLDTEITRFPYDNEWLPKLHDLCMTRQSAELCMASVVPLSLQPLPLPLLIASHIEIDKPTNV